MSQPSSKIKDVYIQLKGYKFHHSPYQNKEDDGDRIIGRKKVKERIKNLLTETNKKSGTYLVTGFRGMGKTSLVRQAIEEVNNDAIKSKQNRNDTLVYIMTFLKWIVIGIVISLIYKILFVPKIKNILPTDILHLLVIFIIFILIAIIHNILICKNNLSFIGYINDFLKFLWNFSKSLVLISIIILAVLFGLIKDIGNNENSLYDLISKIFSGDIFNYTISLELVYSKILPLFAYITLALFCVFILSFIFDLCKYIYLELLTSEKYQSFEINLSQENLSERDILNRINEKLIEFWEQNEVKLMGFRYQRQFHNPINFLFKIMKFKRSKNRHPYEVVLDKMYGLRNRLSGSVSISRDSEGSPDVYAEFQTAFPKLVLPFAKNKDKNAINFPIASAKEAEDELLSIFNLIHCYDRKDNVPDFIFIIDELDKIDPQSSSISNELDGSIYDINLNEPGTRQYRKRQEAVANLLANMKGFLNVAKAKFFFIGGRELFDADMADIADRDSFYSSIFNDVIYVSSFYKDSISGSSREGVTALTEAFLIKNIIGIGNEDRDKDNEEWTIDHFINGCVYDDEFKKIKFYITKSNGNNKIDNHKIIFLTTLLQNFIIFLLYRSNGSPKKLTSLLEHYIVKEENINDSFRLKHLLVDMDGCNSHLYLKLSYNQQYEINLTADMVRPYFMHHSRYLKSLGDKLLFSTPFIFDHLLKFHPFGFSWRNIELIPEVILANKEPHLRDHIRSILSFMGNYLVKDTISGIFDYKFHSVIRKELQIMTKTSDLASAAFNFTLDESLQVKRHYKKKLIELREKYKNYQPIDGDNQFVHSLHFVQIIMGNLYFYDKEYDEAILYYTEAIQTLRLPASIDERRITRHQFLLWLTTKLRLGLTLEKLEAYESAISIYRSVMIDAKRYLDVLGWKKVNDDEHTKYTDDDAHLTEIHRTMQSMIQPHIALLAVIEKNRVDGIDYNNLLTTIEEVREIIEPETISQDEFKNDYRRAFLWGDFYGNVGSILYYKNCQFSKFYSMDLTKSDFDEDIETKSNTSDIEKIHFQLLYFLNNINLLKLDKSDKSIFEKVLNLLQLKSNENLEYSDNEITWIKSMYSNLHNHSKVVNNSCKRYDFYPSSTAIVFYINALKHLTDYHEPRIRARSVNIAQSNNTNQELNPIQVCALYLHGDFVDMINGRRFYYLANLISKIGDAIYSSLKKNEHGLDTTICDIKNLDHKLSEKYNHNAELKGLLKNTFDKACKFDIDYVMKLYFLAGELFKRSGQAYYYSFTLKKMLYVMKDVIKSPSKQAVFTGGKLWDDTGNVELDVILNTIEYDNSNNNWKITHHAKVFKYCSDTAIEFSLDAHRICGDGTAQTITTKDSDFKIENNTINLNTNKQISKTSHFEITSTHNTYPFIQKKVVCDNDEEFVVNVEIWNPSSTKVTLGEDFILDLGKCKISKVPYTSVSVVQYDDQNKNYTNIISDDYYKDHKNPFKKTNVEVASNQKIKLKISFDLLDDINPSLKLSKCEIDNSTIIETWKYQLGNQNKFKDDIYLDLKSNFDENEYDLNKIENCGKILMDIHKINAGANPVKVDFTAKCKTKPSFVHFCNDSRTDDPNMRHIDLVIKERDFEVIVEQNGLILTNLSSIIPNATDFKVLRICTNKKDVKFGNFVIQNQNTVIVNKKITIKSKENIVLTLHYMPKKANGNHPCFISTCVAYAEKLTMEIAASNTWQNEIANKPTITKYRNILNINDNKSKNENSTNRILYRNVNNSSDIREAVLVTESIKLRLNQNNNGWRPKFEFSQYDRANNKYIRMLEMKFRAEQLYYQKGSETCLDNIIEALFCIRECIVIVQLYDPGYIIGYSYLAAAHYWAVYWCKLFNDKLEEVKDKDKRKHIMKKLKDQIGRNSMLYIDPNYHREAAIQNYHKVLQMHSEGEAYKDKVLGLYMLEDDYNDLLSHFQIAMERFRVNTGEIRDSINKLQKHVDKSRLYKYDNYG